MGLKLDFKLQYIKWIDHVSHNTQEWREQDDYDELKPAEIVSVGWVLKDEKDYVVLGQTIHHIPKTEYEPEYNRITGDICILKGCIVEQKDIKI